MPSVAISTTGTVATIGENGSDSGQFNFEIELAAPAGAGHFVLLLEAGAGPPDPISCGAPGTGGESSKDEARRGTKVITDWKLLLVACVLQGDPV